MTPNAIRTLTKSIKIFFLDSFHIADHIQQNGVFSGNMDLGEYLHPEYY